VVLGGVVLFAAALVTVILISPRPSQPIRTLATSLPVEDSLSGKSIGTATGIRWTHAIGDHGAVFSAADSSRIEYPGVIPPNGTLEFWIRVNDGYRYNNYRLLSNQKDAMIFSSDAQGGDVTWPGTTKIFVNAAGKLQIWMATSKYDKPNAVPTEAAGTSFRFGEWHAIGVSYGSSGQYIMLDGNVVASAPGRTQTFGEAGNHNQPLDVPTIGETVSHFWAHHRYEGGFDGVLAAFRVSANQQDWLLAKGVENNNPPAQTTATPISDEDQREHQLVYQAQDFFNTRNYDAALAACNEALVLNAEDQSAIQLKNQIQAALNPPTAPSAVDARPVTSANEFAMVIDPPSNIRTAPSAASGILCSVTTKMPIRILGFDGSWYKTDTCEGRLGYIHRSQIKF
jgi:hypothetical protein